MGPPTTFEVLLVCPGGGPDSLSTASFSGGRLPAEGEEIEVVRADGSRVRAVVRIADTEEEPPITAALLE